MRASQMVKGSEYIVDGQTMVFSRVSGTGYYILHPPGEPDMQSSVALKPDYPVTPLIALKTLREMMIDAIRDYAYLDLAFKRGEDNAGIYRDNYAGWLDSLSDSKLFRYYNDVRVLRAIGQGW